jgi:rubrerythrin
MAGIFNVSEVVGMAVEIEKRGEAFYLEMAERAKDRKVRETLAFLAGEEAKHRRVFGQILSTLGPPGLPAGSSESEYWEYVNDLIDSHFLFDSEASRRALAAAATDQEAVHLAMGFEKESILFFLEMKGLVPAEHARAVDACLQEERRHLRKLAAVMREGR